MHRLLPRATAQLLKQEFRVAQADVCIIGYKMYLGSIKLFRLGQQLSQASCKCAMLMLCIVTRALFLNLPAICPHNGCVPLCSACRVQANATRLQ